MSPSIPFLSVCILEFFNPIYSMFLKKFPWEFKYQPIFLHWGRVYILRICNSYFILAIYSVFCLELVTEKLNKEVEWRNGSTAKLPIQVIFVWIHCLVWKNGQTAGVHSYVSTQTYKKNTFKNEKKKKKLSCCYGLTSIVFYIKN